MGTTNAHWYSRNQAIAYPLDDAATAADDTGAALPGNVLVDLALRWPATLGNRAFLAALSVTPAAVTLTIQGAASETDAGGFTPLAALTLPQPVTAGRAYALSPQAAGVGGWVVFGGGVSDRPVQRRFSAPGQGLLALRAARPYRPLPITGLQADGAGAVLSGIVTLRGLAPLTVTAEEREIGGVLRDCVVLRLEEDAGSGFAVPTALAAAVGEAESSVFERFAGPCGARPETRNCGDPQPIEFINAVGPDCDGVITIALEGCATPIPAGPGAAVISCAFGLAQACPPKVLPDSLGNLPHRLPPAVFVSESNPAPPRSATGTSGGATCVECFSGGSNGTSTQVGLWHVIADSTDLWRGCAGDFSSLSGSLPAGLHVLETNSAAGRNVATLDCAGLGLANRRVTADVKLMPGPVGALRNAAVIGAYQNVVDSTALFVYYAAELDYDTQQLRLLFYNGAALLTLAQVAAPGIKLDTWYSLSLESALGSFGPRTLTATAASLADAALAATVSSPEIGTYPTYYGLLGAATNRAIARFSTLKAESV